MKKPIMIISALVLVALIAGNVFAWEHGKGRRTGCGGQGVWNDLSQDQRDELIALRQKFVDETYELRSANFQKHQEMRLLMETSSPDRAKLDKISRELTDLQQQLRDSRIDFALAAKKISPKLGMGPGFGKGRGNRSGNGCQNGYQKRGTDCPRYNN